MATTTRQHAMRTVDASSGARSLRPRLVDAGLAVGVGAIVATAAVRSEEPGSRSPELAGWLLAVVVVGLLLVRRRFPVGVLVGVTLATLAYNMAGFASIGFVWPLLASLYTAAAAGRLLIAILVGAGMVGLDTGWLLFADHHPLVPVMTMSTPDLVVTGLAIALGDAVRGRRRLAAQTREELRRMSEEKERDTRQAIVEHRLRIAREIHDVTAHTLAVVAVQINVAADALPDTPAEAARALETARQVSHQAIGELRSAVRVLRTPGDLEGDGHDLTGPQTPMPGLPDLPGLIENCRAAGLDVVLRESGDPGPVSRTIGLTLYRILQEALTNVVKHADATHTQVVIEYGPSAVTVRVTDDGSGRNAPGPPGNGLIGLTERAAGVGGTLTAGPGTEGGFTVRARLPATEDA